MIAMVQIGNKIFNLNHTFCFYMDEDELGMFIGVYNGVNIHDVVVVRFDTEEERLDAMNKLYSDINRIMNFENPKESRCSQDEKPVS